MYDNILLAVDLTDPGSWAKALPLAVQTCQVFQATLHLLAVVPDYGMTVVGQFFPEDFEKRSVAAAAKELDALAGREIPAGVEVRPIVAYGSIYEEILATARRIGCDLIVMASCRAELKDYLLGPNAGRVVRYADCSVLVVRG